MSEANLVDKFQDDIFIEMHIQLELHILISSVVYVFHVGSDHLSVLFF